MAAENNFHPTLGHSTWPCEICTSDDDTREPMIECSNDECRRYYHYSCVKINKENTPGAEDIWLCPKCSKIEEFKVSDNNNTLSKSTGAIPKNKSTTIGATPEKQIITANPDQVDLNDKIRKLEELIQVLMKINSNNASFQFQLPIDDHNKNTNINLHFPNDQLNGKDNLNFPDNQNTVFKIPNTNVDTNKNLINGVNVINREDITANTDTSFNPEYLTNANFEIPRLSQGQIEARKIFKTLPEFDGTPSKWVGFYSSYLIANQACNYQNYENMHRLKLALKGKALAAVEEVLNFPNSVEQAINILKLRFGRQEYIVNEMLDSLRRFPKCKRDQSREWIINYSTFIIKLESSLRNAGGVDYLRNPLLLTEMLEKLPDDIQMSWAIHANTKNETSIADFSAYLSTYANIASTLLKAPIGNETSRRINLHNTSNPHSNFKCEFCQKDHWLKSCEKFKRNSYDDRKQFGLKNGICFVCARKGHTMVNCNLRKSGTKTLHPIFRKTNKNLNNFSTPTEPAEKSNQEDNVERNMHVKQEDGQILFKIMPVTIHNGDNMIDTYALMDSGSSVTLIDESLAKLLDLKGTKEQLCYSFSDQSSHTEENSLRVTIQLSAKQNSRKYMVKNVRTVKKLDLPSQSINPRKLSQKYSYLQGIDMADLYEAKPTILIGLEHSNLMTPTETRAGNGPIAHKTLLGWSVFGSSDKACINLHKIMQICKTCEKNDTETEKMVKDFFSIESCGAKFTSTVKNIEDLQAETIIKETTAYDGERYVTGLLWKNKNIKLPNSYKTALNRLYCTERKIKKQNLEERYNDEIRKLVENGYAKKLNKREQTIHNPRTWYLPHFNVYNPNKPNKFRIVFDAAQKTNSISLNSVLLTGPDLYTSMLAILIQFRIFPIAVCADIKEMFQQIKILDDDQQSQRFLWRDCDRTKEPDQYILQVMTFGATCSPTLAHAIKNLNAKRFENEYPVAVNAIVEKHFVDDYLDSFKDEKTAIEISNQVKMIHQHGGFELRNWVSNSRNFLKVVAKNEIDKKSMDMNKISEKGCEKVLGMFWEIDDDVFTFRLSKTKIPDEIRKFIKIPTKRELLRIVMSVFDPFGLIANFIVEAKVILQQLWLEGVSWDTPIPTRIFECWKRWFVKIIEIENIRIPRCFYYEWNKVDEIEIHTFCDASELACAAVTYIRLKLKNGSIYVSLIGSKTKVAPTKHLTVPRLELQAALIGARLTETIKNSLNQLKINQINLWSDSKTVLSWIGPNHSIYKQWVAVRVSEILDTTVVSQWRHVPTVDNVADEATKWKIPPSVDTENRWFKGPSFLYQAEHDWPQQKIEEPQSQDEIRTIHRINSIKIVKDYEKKFNMIDHERFSQYTRLLRCVAWLYKLMSKEICSQPNIKHIEKAELYLIKKAQWDVYKETILQLKKNNSVNCKDDLHSLVPFLDDDGIIRMYGRLKYAVHLPYSTKFPMILPRKHHITKLIVRYYHIKFAHQLQETVVNELRKKYWIPNIRIIVKSVKNNCGKCLARSKRPSTPFMASLPEVRIKPYIKPFYYTFLDYFGPIFIKIGRKLHKRWGALYSCMVTRAITLDLVYSLTSEAAIMSIENLINRRGIVKEIYSDCATTFKGASKEICEESLQLDHEEVKAKLAIRNIDWKFSPPASPHMNGAVERMVRIVKSVYKSLLVSDHPSEDVLRHLFYSTENIVNSRPLNYTTIEPGSEEVLTANHFLLGISNELPTSDAEVFGRRQWKYIQTMKKHFWQRFNNEYVTTLNKRAKWQTRIRPVKIDDLVLIVDDQTQRSCWKTGRIIETYKGKDDTIRSAKVKTVTGELVRPVLKLIILNIEDGDYKIQ